MAEEAEPPLGDEVEDNGEEAWPEAGGEEEEEGEAVAANDAGGDWAEAMAADEEEEEAAGGEAGAEAEGQEEGAAEGEAGEAEEGQEEEGAAEEGALEGQAGQEAEDGTGGTAAGGYEVFRGLACQVGGKTGNLLIRCFRVRERYGQEAMILKAQYPEVQLGDRMDFKVIEREGQRPLASEVSVIGHVENFIPESDFKGRAPSKGGGHVPGYVPGKAGGPLPGKGKGKGLPMGVCRDLYYVGVIKVPKVESPPKYFVRCRQIGEMYGGDAWIPAVEKPPSVHPGNLVVFTVRRNGEVGTGPRAFGVAKLASPDISMLQQAAQGARNKGAQKGGAPGNGWTAPAAGTAAPRSKPPAAAGGAAAHATKAAAGTVPVRRTIVKAK